MRLLAPASIALLLLCGCAGVVRPSDLRPASHPLLESLAPRTRMLPLADTAPRREREARRSEARIAAAGGREVNGDAARAKVEAGVKAEAGVKPASAKAAPAKTKAATAKTEPGTKTANAKSEPGTSDTVKTEPGTTSDIAKSEAGTLTATAKTGTATAATATAATATAATATAATATAPAKAEPAANTGTAKTGTAKTGTTKTGTAKTGTAKSNAAARRAALAALGPLVGARTLADAPATDLALVRAAFADAPGARSHAATLGALRRDARKVSGAPRPADLLFFHGAGGAAEVAIVRSVGGDGVIDAIAVTRGAVRAIVIDSAHPDARRRGGRIVNTFLRARRPGDEAGAAYLAGQLLDVRSLID